MVPTPPVATAAPTHGARLPRPRPARAAVREPRQLPGRGALPGARHDHAAAAARLGAGIVQVDGRGGRRAADLFPARAEPGQLRQALALPGRAADLSRQQRRRGTSHHPFLPGADHSGRLRAGALSHTGQGVLLPAAAARADRSLSGAADAAVLHVRAAEAAQFAGRAGDRPYRDPAAVQRLHHAQCLRGGAARAGGGSGDRRLQQLAGAGPRVPAGHRAGGHHGRAVCLHHLVERAAGRPGHPQQGSRPSRCR